MEETRNEYRDILYQMNEGFVILEVIFNENQEPADYRFLEYNAEFEKLTGWYDVKDKLRSELQTPFDKKWIEIYGQIVKTGEPAHFESEAFAQGNFYEVRAFRLGGNGSRRVAVLFNNVSLRKKAEEDLKKSEQQHRSFFESGMVGVIYWMLEGKILDANSKFLQMTGYSKEDLLTGQINWYSLTPEEYRERDDISVEELKRLGLSETYEKEYIRKDGTRISILIASALIDESNLQGVSFVLDISERKQAEKMMAQLSAIVQNSEEAIISKDLNGVIQTWNLGAEKMYGYSADEVFGKNISILIPPGQPNEIPKLIRRIVSEETIENYETLRQRKDGSIIPVSINLSPIRNTSGEIIGISKITHDISRRKEMEEELRESEQKWITTLSCIGDAVIATDAKKRITFINREAENLTGWDHREVIRKPVNHFLNIIDEITSAPIDYASISEVRVANPADQLKLIPKNGREIPIDYTAAPIQTSEGKKIGVILVFRDISSRKEAEMIMRNYSLQLEEKVRSRTVELENAKDRAESADRLKTAFLLNMSHELRTPLNSIIGFSGILLNQLAGPLNTEQKKQIDMVLKSGKHLLSLINDILDISKIEAGELKPDYSSVDLPDLISEVLRLVESQARNKGLMLSFENNFISRLMITDKVRVRQILINLIFNAVKFTETGEVKIRCWAESDLVRIEITDTGIGIRAEDLDKLFNPFVQLENSLIRKFEGSGLGLSISKKLTDMLNGSIIVHSQAGKGSTFTLALPVNRSK